MEVSTRDLQAFSQMDHSDGANSHPHDDSKPRKRVDAVTVLADGTVLKLQKTRQRKIFSCVYCHSKKIKCSRESPICKNCKANNMECKYFVNERVSRGGSKKALSLRRRSSLSMNSDRSETYMDSESAASDIPESMRIRDSDYSSLTSNSSSLPSKAESEGASKDFMGSRIKNEPIADPIKNSFFANDSKDVTGDPVVNLQNYPSSFISNITSPNLKAENLHLQNVASLSPEPNPPGTLQAPVMNSGSNNITNKFFNTNYGTKPIADLTSEENYAFNMSSFSMISPKENDLIQTPQKIHTEKPEKCAGDAKAVDSLYELNGFNDANREFKTGNVLENTQENQLITTNFVDGPSSSLCNPSIDAYSKASGSASLSNSLNPYASNPATTINYLYGTNINYDNVNLLLDLLRYVPNSRKRSYELIERYMSSVHILLPLMVNIEDFIEEHDRYWEKFHPYSHSQSEAFAGSKTAEDHFDFLQFYTLYFPVLYAATISEFEEYDNLLLNQDIDNFLKAFNKICQHYNYPHGFKSIPVLLGNVIIQSTSPNPSTMEMSQIIRYAKFLHLHKDPLITLRISDWRVIKFRRMLWWVIFGLDTLSSHNFCLPPVCRADDFNVLFPDDHDPVFNADGEFVKKRLNVSVLVMSIKFHYDRIVNRIVFQLHNGLSLDITDKEANEIKDEIVKLFHFIYDAISRMTAYYKASLPTSVQEMNIFNFVKNHSWSFVDRALMLLHKKILVADCESTCNPRHSVTESYDIVPKSQKGNSLALNAFEDTYGKMQETNIINNLDKSSISQLRFNTYELFYYENLQNNLIPSILHNLNDFLKYNDFIKFGKFNWYIKRTIPLDSIILLLVIICVKFKYDFIGTQELQIYVQLISKVLFIFNRKYFKNEKYKRMLSLTNLTWEYILKKYDVLKRINLTNELAIEFMDHQVTGFMNMSDLFSVMNVPQPAYILNGVDMGSIRGIECSPAQRWHADLQLHNGRQINLSGDECARKVVNSDEKDENWSVELMQLKEKICYDLRNNFVDVNDYCTFYSSLESILNELIKYIDCPL